METESVPTCSSFSKALSVSISVDIFKLENLFFILAYDMFYLTRNEPNICSYILKSEWINMRIEIIYMSNKSTNGFPYTFEAFLNKFQNVSKPLSLRFYFIHIYFYLGTASRERRCRKHLAFQWRSILYHFHYWASDEGKYH